MTIDLKKFLIPILRRGSYKWPPRTEALKKARVSYGKYQCNKCKEVFRKKDIAVDHVRPVVASSGFRDWDTYIQRLYCKASGFQILCKPCHDEKTKKENKRRVKK